MSCVKERRNKVAKYDVAQDYIKMYDGWQYER